MTTIKQTAEAVAALGTDTELLLPHIELHADCRAVVDGCRGIVAYDETCVRLNCGTTLVTLTGSGLCLEQLNGEHICVCGSLATLSFSAL